LYLLGLSLLTPVFFFKKKNGIGQCNFIISLKKIVKNTHKHIKITQKN
jgi:hypothetical protein